MRDTLIVVIVLGAALVALRRPWIGVMLWTWLSIMNPHRYAWGIAYSAPLAAIAAGSTLLGLLFSSDKQSPFKGAAVWWFALLTAWITISWLFGLNPSQDYPLWEKVMKIYLMTFVALALLSTRFHIIAFAWITTASLSLLAAKGGLFTLLTGGNFRVWGPPGSFIRDNNEFALATIITVPMLYFLYSISEHRWLRYTLIMVIGLSVVSAVGSYSRGGFLALIAMGGFLWWRSQYKILTGVLLLAAIALYLPMMPEQWWDRMATIQEYDQDASAMGRINAWIVAWETAKAYPLGAGMSYQHPELFQRFGVHEDTVRAAHSVYFQMLGNHGLVGLCLYLGLWVSTYRTAGWLKNHARSQPETEWAQLLGSMIQVSLVGFAVGGAFLSLAYFDLPYNLMVLVVVAKLWVLRVQARAKSTVAGVQGAPNPSAPEPSSVT